MKKNILQQVGTSEELYTVTIIDTPETVDELTGETIPAVTHEETHIRTVPIMQAVTVDMTPEEEAALMADAPEPEPPDRLAIIEQTVATHDEEINEIVTGLEALANG